MFERFTNEARGVFVLAQDEARQMGHGSVGTEHLLLGLVDQSEGIATQALVSVGISEEAVRDKVIETVGPVDGSENSYPPFSPRAKKVLELSLREAIQLGQSDIGPGHLLLGLLREGEGTGVQVLVSLGADLAQLRQNAIQLLVVEEPLLPGETVTDAYRLSDMSFFGTVRVGQRQGLPWWRPFPERRMRRWRREQLLADARGRLADPKGDRENRVSNGKELRDAFTAFDMSFEELAEASGIEVERLQDAVGTEPQVDLMFAEWVRLAVVFEGHTWDEFTAKRPGGWVAGSGHILEGARKLVRDTFSQDGRNAEDA